MPDRPPEELLDQWLDALNDGGVSPAPDSIADLAAVAHRYRNALGTPVASPERNGKMHHALSQTRPLATPHGTTWALPATTRPRAGWSSWLATAAVFALLIGMVGGAYLRQFGLPGGADPTQVAGIAASPAASPAAGQLSCAAPGYLAVVAGNPAASELAVLGGPDRLIRETGDGVLVPLPGGETRELPPDSVIYPDSDVALAIHDDNAATASRISTGETWDYPSVKPRVEGQPYWDFFTNGRYVIGPTDDSRTDWLITDTLTGDTRTTADILGEPFAGSLDLWTHATSENGDVWLLQFLTLTFSGHDETPPADVVHAPGYLVIPGSLDDAWFNSSSRKAEPIETVVSPEGTSYIVQQAVRDPRTGERVDAGTGNATFVGQLIGFLDEDTLLTYRGDVVNIIDIHTGVATPVYTAQSGIQSVAWDRDAGTLAVGSGSRGPTTWALVDLDSGEATALPELDGYQLANVSMFGPVGRVEGAAAFTQPADGGELTVRALDMVTGTVSDSVTIPTYTQVSGLESRVPAWSEGRYVRTIDVAGTPLFIDAGSGTVVRLSIPEGVAAPDGGRLDISVVPGGDCATLTPRDSDGNAIGHTWIASIAPDAAWTELPFTIEGWRELNVEEVRTLPAQDVATPAG